MQRMGIAGVRMLDRAIDRLWAVAQGAANRDQHEDFSIALRTLSELKRGSVDPFLTACASTTGLTPINYRRRRMERSAQIAWELAQDAVASQPVETPAKVIRISA